MAEHFAFKVHTEMISKLQSMGYLPRIPTGVVAQLVGASSGDAIATYDQLSRRLEELTSVDKELGLLNPKIVKQRRMLKELVQRGRTAVEIDQMLDHPPSEN